MATDGHQLIGVDIYKKTMRACRFDCLGNPFLKVELSLPQPAMPGAITVALCEGVRSIDPSSRAAFVGISFYGEVDLQGRIAKKSYEMPGWSDVPLADWLELRLSRQVTLINNFKCLVVGQSLQLNSNHYDLIYTRGAAIIALEKFRNLVNNP